MSSDLLAEFDSFYTGPASKQISSTPAANDLAFLGGGNHSGSSGLASGSSPWQTSAPKTSDDIWGNLGSFQPSSNIQAKPVNHGDLWGSFEAAIPAQVAPPRQPNSRQGTGIRSGVVRRPTIDLFSQNISDPETHSTAVSTTSRYPPPSRPKPARQSSTGGDILFDATDELSGNTEDDDDDFGDFETVTSPQVLPAPSGALLDFFATTAAPPIESKPSKRPKDLLSTSTNLAADLPYPQAPKSPSFQERNPFADLGLATTQVRKIKNEEKPQSASPVTAWPTYEPPPQNLDLYQDSPAIPDPVEDEWGDFADLAPETPAVKSAQASSGIEADAWAWDNADKVIEPTPPIKPIPPPTNVPPPSVILSLFPPLFDLPQSALFQAVANQPFSLKNRIISDPSTIDFLRAYLLIATVAARIIAGRKLRWKRDTLLSQSMKIGPAAAGGKGGMKLTGVDKTEVTKEDREAADVVRVWREQIGRLKSAIAIANTSIKDVSRHLTIPELGDVMSVKTQDGALTAPKPCVICGLKREERVSKVDLQVEDSFGEWWTEHWGHRICRNFWQEHESKLKHR